MIQLSDYSGDITSDTLFNGRLVCKQPKQGYRFSVDAVLAAHFPEPGPRDSILDLGCGCGIIGLILAYRHNEVTLAGIEIQDELAALARENSINNGLGQRYQILAANYRQIPDLFEPESFDMVISNPPYRQQGRGRINLGSQKARARHELDATLEDLTRAAAFAVKNRGRVVIIYPAFRTAALVTELKKNRLEPKRIQPVYSCPGSANAILVLIEAMKNGGERVDILKPFYIYMKKNGPYTDEMQQLYR